MNINGIRPNRESYDSVIAHEAAKEKVYKLNQVAIRMVDMPPLLCDTPMDGPEAAVKVMADMLKDYDREVVAIVNLQTDGRPINMNVVSMGALDQSIAHPREILKSTILSNASAIMLVHNHPSNKLQPSMDDIATTARVKQLCDLIGVRFLDHIIVGPGRDYYSFHQKQQIPLSSLKLTNNLEDIELEGLRVAEKNTIKEGKKTVTPESRDKRTDELHQITDKLEKGVKDVFRSDKYKQFLNTMAKFPRYSVNNTMLIMMQRPDAQLCQSFTGWKEMGRYVKKGEKGISILAPAPYKIEREQTKLDDKGRPVLDADGEPVTEKVEVTIRAFKVAKTFDVSQTDGKELPSIGPDELVGSIEGYPKLLQALQEISPVPVTFEQIDGEAKGFYHQEDKRIAIQEGMSEVQTIKTLLHEMAHQKLHDKDAVTAAEHVSRNGKEVEAESVAYVVCQHYGINTSDYSFSYVAGWSEGKEIPELKSSLDKVRQTAADFIYRIDQKLEVLQADREQGFIPVVPDSQEKVPNPDLKVAVDKALENLDKKRTQEKKKTSVKSKIKEKAEKAEATPKKTGAAKMKEERA